MVFTLEELNLIREWFNVVEDVSPKYLEQRDKDLGRRIEDFCRQRASTVGQWEAKGFPPIIRMRPLHPGEAVPREFEDPGQQAAFEAYAKKYRNVLRVPDDEPHPR
jgi:hypothetical protein